VSIATDELQRLLFDRITDAVAIVDSRSEHFPIIDANGAFRDLLDDPGRSLAGEPWASVVPRAEEQGLLDIFARVAASGEPFQARDFPYRPALPPDRAARPDDVRYWDWQCLPLGDSFGPVERLVVILADVTDRQQQRRTRIINHRFVEQVSLGVLVTTGIDHRVVVVSPRLVYLGDQTVSRLVGRPVFAALPALASAGLAPLMAEVYATGVPHVAEEFTFQLDGERDPVVWNLSILPLPGLDGGTEGLMLTVADLSAQARARRESDAQAEAARRRAGELEAVLGAIPDGIFLLDPAGRVVEANEPGLRLLGLATSPQSRSLLELLVTCGLVWDDERPVHTGDALLAAAFSGRRAADNLVLVGPLAPGTSRRYLALRAMPVASDEGAGGAVILLRDITPQREAEQEKDAFLSLIAHQVKSPLTAIKGFAQLARRASGPAGDAGERIARHLGVIEQQADRIGRLVDELADANQLRKGTLRLGPAPCDLAALARAAVEAQQSALAPHRIAFAVAGDPLPLHADPARIAQVIGHLLLNAARFSPVAGRIDLTLARAGRSAHLAVRDQGIGIPPADLARIFERFHRAANATAANPDGLGLGLFIAREIITRSGGTLTAESTLGAGSTFHLTLPLADDTPSD
jgi:signal transduction histidine kinase